MPDHMRWRHGDTNHVLARVDAATVIEIGDLVWLDVDNAKPASMLPEVLASPEGRLLIPMEEFAARFLGVAMQRSQADVFDPIRVATTGVFDFPCLRATFELGDFVAVNAIETVHANAKPGPCLIDNQRVVKVATPTLAIARVAKPVPIASGSVLLDIRSTVMTGGIAGTTAVKN